MANKTFLIALLSFTAALSTCTVSSKTDEPASESTEKTQVSKTWVSDQGDGTYINPILHADYSDPDVIRVGDDFYMTTSSFQSAPGLPILHSKDLVNWTIANISL